MRIYPPTHHRSPTFPRCHDPVFRIGISVVSTVLRSRVCDRVARLGVQPGQVRDVVHFRQPFLHGQLRDAQGGWDGPGIAKSEKDEDREGYRRKAARIDNK